MNFFKGKILLVLLPLFISQVGFSDSLTIKKQPLLSQLIVPSALIASGLYVEFSNGVLGKENLQSDIQEAVGGWSTGADDYLVYVPLLEIAIFDICGLQAENHWFGQLKYATISGALVLVVTQGLKYTTHQMRPDGSSDNSFPSGHTSMAFWAATLLYREFKEANIWLALSGYTFATATAALRVVNNRHWVSDVLVGAGIGMLFTNLVYYYQPFKEWNPFSDSDLSFYPTFNPSTSQLGFSLAYSFE